MNTFKKNILKWKQGIKSLVFCIGEKNSKIRISLFLAVLIIIISLLFLKNSDKFSSIDKDLERIDMTDLPLYVKHEVPFTSQAPSKQWQDPLYQDACEEASIIMVTHWLAGETEDIGVGKAELELEELFKVTEDKYGSSIDLSAEDTAELLREYSKSDRVNVTFDVNLENIIRALADGNVIIVPADGEWLDNKYFSGTGPERHMVVVIGYDYKKKEFITNDSGTGKGKGFRYTFDNLMTSIRNYRTGEKVSISDVEDRVMIIVGR